MCQHCCFSERNEAAFLNGESVRVEEIGTTRHRSTSPLILPSRAPLLRSSVRVSYPPLAHMRSFHEIIIKVMDIKFVTVSARTASMVVGWNVSYRTHLSLLSDKDFAKVRALWFRPM